MPTPETARNQNSVAHSVKELRLLQASQAERAVAFDLVATLIFTSPYREIAYFQDGDTPLLVKLNEDDRTLLLGLRAGARIRIQGDSTPGPRGINAHHIEIVGRIGVAKVRDAAISPEQRGTPLNRYGTMEAEIKEIALVGELAKYYATEAAVPVEFWLFQPLQFSDALHYIGSRVRVFGVVTRHELRQDTGSLHKLLLMHREQIQQLAVTDDRMMPQQEDPSPDLALFGTVVFSNGTNRLAMVTNQQRYMVRTRFANSVAPGDRIYIYGRVSWNHRQDLVVLTNKVLKVYPTSAEAPSLIKPAETAAEVSETGLKWLSQNQLPSRAKIRGTVHHVRHLDSTVEIHIESEQQQCIVVLARHPGSNSEMLPEVVLGSSISAVGMPVRSNIDFDNSRKPDIASLSPLDVDTADHAQGLHLYVASAEDVVIHYQPIQFSLRSIAIIALVVAGLLSGASVWNYFLRRQVASRTSSLNSATSHMRTAFDAVREAVLVIDTREVLCRSNPRFEQIFGFTPAEGDSLEMILNPIQERCESGLLPWHDSRIINERPFTGEFRLRDPERIVQLYINPIKADDGVCAGQLWVFEDVTERRRLETELLQAQKMEAIGHLSGGLAHDFNNFLTVIRSSLDMIRLHQKRTGTLDDDQALSEYVSVADIAVDHAVDLTQQLLGFARRSRLECEVVRVNDVLDEVEHLVRRAFDHRVRLEWERAPEDAWFDVDTNRIQQALINLCLNGRDAMQVNGGVLRLNAKCVTKPGLGEVIHISVHDTGSGMSAETLKHAFEPFFTTKDVGTGTGLGLSVTQGVIQQHGGRLECRSAPDEGTQMDIYLPQTRQDQSAAPRPVASKPIAVQATLRLLLVDDDPLVRSSATSLLKAYGYDVLTASSGIDSLRRLATELPFDVVILDLTMPEMSGIETYHEIRSAWPRQRIVFCSGYSNESGRLDELPEATRPPLLAKPFRIEEMQAVLASVLPKTSSKPATATMKL